MNSRFLSAQLALFALVAFGLCACGKSAPTREWTPLDHGVVKPGSASTEQGPAAGAVDDLEQQAMLASVYFQLSCASCHGADGMGGQGTAPIDFTSEQWQASRTDAQIVATIKTGRGMMPSFADRYGDEQLLLLLTRVRAFGVRPEQGD